MTEDQIAKLILGLLGLWGLWMAVFVTLTWSRLGSLGERLGSLGELLDGRAKSVQQTFCKADASFTRSVQTFQTLVEVLQDLENLRQVSLKVDEACTRVRDTHDAIDSQVATSGEVVKALHRLVERWSEEGADLRLCYKGMAEIFEVFLTRVESDRLRQQALLEQLAAERSLAREEEVHA